MARPWRGGEEEDGDLLAELVEADDLLVAPPVLDLDEVPEGQVPEAVLRHEAVHLAQVLEGGVEVLPEDGLHAVLDLLKEDGGVRRAGQPVVEESSMKTLRHSWT